MYVPSAPQDCIRHSLRTCHLVVCLSTHNHPSKCPSPCCSLITLRPEPTGIYTRDAIRYTFANFCACVFLPDETNRCPRDRMVTLHAVATFSSTNFPNAKQLHGTVSSSSSCKSLSTSQKFATF